MGAYIKIKGPVLKTGPKYVSIYAVINPVESILWILDMAGI